MKKLLENFEEVISAGLLMLLFVTLIWQIVSRQILNDPAIWTEELARLIFIYMSMFACATAVKHRHHVSIAFFVEKLPERMMLATLIIMDVLVCFLLCYLIYLGWKVAMRNQFLELITLGISNAWLYGALCLGAGLMLFRLVERIVGDLRTGSIPTQTKIMS
ncbi:TRAP transporter small permease [Endozoicomonas ascidiicola]|uniref:TRAP transporter small permease n=1 Tax=Endozoicomonas ascidiicola TaxID=1698521 RepID=UPI00083404AE|nr:TRAP transporter small permease [Endozoicomonas ascidiicola]